MSDIHDAVAEGDLAHVRALVQKPRTDLDLRDAEGRTPLHRAIELDGEDIALELLHSGADPSLRFFTTRNGRPRYHLDGPFGKDDLGMNSLHLAAMRSKTTIIRAIMDHSELDINAVGFYESGDDLFLGPALLFSISKASPYEFPSGAFSEEVASALLDHGADVNAIGGEFITLLHLCAYHNDDGRYDQQRLALMRAALDRGAAMDTEMFVHDIPDMQPLHIAVYTGFYEGARVLVEAGAPVNIEPQEFFVPPLFLAPCSGSVPIFELLLQHGADIHALDWKGNNFLHYCVGHRQLYPGNAYLPEAVKMLRAALELGVNVHQQGNENDEFDSENYQPIDTALKDAQWAIPHLMEYGAVLGEHAGFQRTIDSVLNLACCRNFGEGLVFSIQTLLEAGADVHWGKGRSLENLLENYKRCQKFGVRRDECLACRGRAIALLVVAGDRRLDLIPSPCRRLETALVPLWKEAPEDLAGIFQHLEGDVQQLVRTVLLVLNRLSKPENGGINLEQEIVWSIFEYILA